MPRVYLQGVVKNTAQASSAVVEQLNASAGLDVTAFMPRGAEPGTAGTIDIESTSPFWRRCCFSLSGEDITSVGGKARVENLRAAFQDGVDMVTSHSEAKPPSDSNVYPQGEDSPLRQQRCRGLVDSDSQRSSLCLVQLARAAGD